METLNSVIHIRYIYPFYVCNCLHIAISFYQNQQSRKSYKVLVFNLRGHFTPKCRSPPFFILKKQKQRA